MQLHKRLEQSVFLVQKPLKAGVRVDLPTNRAHFFTSDRFFMFFAAKASERAEGPTTGTGNEKRRTLRTSSVRAADQEV